MPKGQQPKPSSIKALEGNRSKLGRDRIKSDPQGIGRPLLPAHLTPDERKVYAAVVDSLPATLLTRADTFMLEMFASEYTTWRAVKSMIEKSGLLVQSPNGPIRNPLLVIRNHAVRHCHMLGGDLGLSPAARARLLADEVEDTDDPMALLMGDDGDDDAAWSTRTRN